MDDPAAWKVLDENSVELYPGVPTTPIFEWHSPTDALIPVDSIDNTLRPYCATGTPVTTLTTPTPDHLSAAALGLPQGWTGWTPASAATRHPPPADHHPDSAQPPCRGQDLDTWIQPASPWSCHDPGDCAAHMRQARRGHLRIAPGDHPNLVLRAGRTRRTRRCYLADGSGDLPARRRRRGDRLLDLGRAHPLSIRPLATMPPGGMRRGFPDGRGCPETQMPTDTSEAL
nr:lipase family protein [Rhodococcus sp. ZPP]